MSTLRDIRRCALQALYQFDTAGTDALQTVRQTLAHSPGGEDVHEAGFTLACDAWEARAEADAAIEPITPDWPVHRQPVIDRNILRLAHHEITSGRTPPKVAINEAIEIGREYGGVDSPRFINGVLDAVLKRLQKPASEND